MKKSETTPRQRAIKDAFQRCLSAESTQIRDEQLRTVEKDDPDLAAEVRALLDAAGAGNAVEQVFGFVSDPKFEVTHDSEPQPSSASRKSDTAGERPGTIIGHYKLLEQIGEGGMGAVFMAQQTQPIKRKVALKVIKPGMDTGQVVARFEAERQALAMMDHPNIARVLDAGTTDRGRPYFVMELVRGIPITDYCASHKMSTDARLKLFIDVCHGVQHAHQKGIIHRDLKPSNVLVTLHDGKPVVKIIDFGIAKAMNQDLTERTLFTNFAQLIGTPLYMSPEQAELSGLDVDTRSDVYSLGVLLYELLTGSTPFDRETLKRVGIEEIRRMIRETDPPKPSKRLSTLKTQAESTLKDTQTRDLKRSQLELKGELDWIVMKSLEKERERRYESASAFAADVQRYLDDESVLACPPSRVYRFKKFASRNKATFTTAGFIIGALLAGTAVSVWQAVRATQAQTQANANAVRAAVQEQNAIAEAQKARAAATSEREARQSETKERERAIASEIETKSQLYNADMRLGLGDWESGNIARLLEKLMNHLPRPGEKDLRGWEWYYLLGLSKQYDRSFMDRAAQITTVAWSPDGRFLASTGDDGRLIVYERDSWIPVKSWHHETNNAIRGVSWSRDSKSLSYGTKVLVGTPSEIFVQNMETDQLTILDGSMSSVWATAWSPDGKKLASAGMDPWIRVWDLETGKCTLLAETNLGFASSLDWHPNGRWLLSNAGANSTGNLVWDVDTGKPVVDSPSKGGISSATWSVDGKQLALGTKQGNCQLYNTDDWQIISEWRAHLGTVSALKWSYDGQQLATAGEDRSIQIWDSSTAKPLQTFRGSLKKVTSISWEPSGERLASADELTRIWSLSNPQKLRKLRGIASETNDIVWAVDGQTLRSLVVGSILNWMTTDGETPTQIAIPPGTNMKFSNDGARFVMAVPIGDQDEMWLYDANSGNRIRSLTKVTRNSFGDGTHRVAFSPDDSQLAIADRLSVGDLFNIEVVSTTDTAKSTKFAGSIHSFNAVSWSPDGRLLAVVGNGPAAGSNGYVHVFDVSSKKRIKLLQQEVLRLTSVTWSRDGKQIVAGGEDGIATIWEVETGARIVSTNIHSTPIIAVDWSPDGKRMASASRDGVRVWDPLSGEELVSFRLSVSTTTLLKWSVDGQRLAASDSTGAIHVWDASTGYIFANDDEFSLMFIRRQLVKAINDWEMGRKTEAKEFVKQAFYARKIKERSLPLWVSAIAEKLIAKTCDDLNVLEFIVDGVPDDPSFRNRYVLELISSKKLKEALTYLRRSLKIAGNVDENSDSASSLTFLLDQNMLLQDSRSHRLINNIAWQLATHPDEKSQDFDLAVELAMRSIRLEPSYKNIYNTLGVALYRAGKWRKSIINLEKSMEFRDGGDSFDWYFLAMAHWQLDQKSEALKWYQKALDAADGKIPTNDELARFQEEATKLLEIETKRPDEPSVAPNHNE